MPSALAAAAEDRAQDNVSPADAQVLAAAYDYCRRIATSHYENFSVTTRLLPAELRRDVTAIYAFARIADDLADEGPATAELRYRRLDLWDAYLEDCLRGRAAHPVFVALRHTITAHELPAQPFRNLLLAFRQDIEPKGFATFEDLLAYCRHSADPVGRLILALFGYRDAGLDALSDRICTGLQLANFWQDLSVDLPRGRLYLPEADLAAYSVTPAELRHGLRTQPVRRLLAFEVERARALLVEGSALADRVVSPLSWQVRLFAWGGLAILRRIESSGYDVLRQRPTVPRRQKAWLILRAWIGRSTRPPSLRSDAAPPGTGGGPSGG